VLEVIGDRVRVRAQWSVVRMRCVEGLARVHRLITSVAALAMSELGK
jgi:hypothetical protein